MATTTRAKKKITNGEHDPAGVLAHVAALATLIVVQSRAEMSDEAIADYAEAYRAGRKLPAITVIHEGGTSADPESWTRAWVPDGAHRLEAAIVAELPTIEALARPGSEDDAWRAALGANVGHGLRRTNNDKRNAVRTAMARWPKLSARKVAELCAVTHPFVLTLKNEAKAAKLLEEGGDEEEEPTIDTDASYTPRELAEAVAAALGGVDLDPCSHPDAPMWGIAERSIAQPEDGLSADWGDLSMGNTLWLQPPYSEPSPWSAKLIEAFEAGEVRRALVMVMATSMGTPWFTALVERASSVGALRRRVDHIPGGGQKGSRPREGSILIGLGEGIDWAPLLPHAVPFFSRAVAT